jgi:tRNA pseudouridine55 synthase
VTAIRARPPRLAIDGVLLLDKSPGCSSQSAVTRVKMLFNAAKAGHTGTLDPAATGLLPIVLGEATKFSSALLDARKSYLATLRLGQTTTTGDLEGETTSTAEVTAALADIESVLDRFRGGIWQTPPMFSALKHAGKPLYKYAREGAEVERAARRITVYELSIVDYSGRDLRIEVACSKGTYIRVLAEDIGRALRCGACLAALRRTRVGHLDVAEAMTIDGLADLDCTELRARLLPMDALLSDLPSIELDPERAGRIAVGAAVPCDVRPDGELVRLYGPGKAFLGIAVATSAGRLQPQRLVVSNRENVEKAGRYRVK